jgi:hypothetical protein
LARLLWRRKAGVSLPDILSSSGKTVALRGVYFDIATGAGRPELENIIRPKSGFLDNASLRNGAWGRGGIEGQWLVFRGSRTCGVSQFKGPYDPDDFHAPGKGHVSLFASGGKDAPGWRVNIPLRPSALLMAGDRLIVGGSPDAEVDPKSEDPWAIFEGRKGGVLWVASAADGSKVAEYPLSAPPVDDGLAAAYGCLYISTVDGKLLCLGEKKGGMTE